MSTQSIEQGRSPYGEMTDPRPAWQTCGLRIADHFAGQANPLLFTDGDGVVVRGDSLHTLRWTHSDIVPAMRALEESGVTVGLATARGDHFVQHLRGAGLAVSGPAILGGGQLCRIDGDQKVFATREQQLFFADLPGLFRRHKAYRRYFHEVRDEHKEGNVVFCAGNGQWQSALRRTFWLIEPDAVNAERRDGVVAKEFFEQPARVLATKHGLDFDADISLGVNRMHLPDGNVLVIVRFAPKHNGKGITKARAAETFLPDHKGWVFVADGFGDTELAGLTHRRDGLVISVAGNLDISSEPKQFAAMADIRLESPTALVGALYYAALTRAWTSGPREFSSQTLYEFPS